MHFYRPHGTVAGIQASREEGENVPFIELGEIWVSADWKIGSHANSGWELYYQTRGSSLWRVAGLERTVAENGFYLIPRGIQHALLRFEGEDARFFFVVFPEKPENLPLDREILAQLPARSTFGTGAGALLPPFQSLIREVTMPGAHHPRACELHLAALLLELCRLLAGGAPRDGGRGHPAVQRARLLMDQRPGEPWRLDDLARLAGVSAPHLIALFRQEYGLTPKRYLAGVRLDRARAALRQSRSSITVIALDCGFASGQHLSTAFRERFGQTPTDYRRAAGNTHGDDRSG
jgi:AraC-like DNA-binding protein